MDELPVAVLVAEEVPSCWGLTRTGSIDSTTPTRWPPTRTSLLRTSRGLFGISTETR